MHVADPRGTQLCRLDLPVELRIVSRSGDIAAYVYDVLDGVRPPSSSYSFHVRFGWPIAFSSRRTQIL